jgi:hypothetical protein
MCAERNRPYPLNPLQSTLIPAKEKAEITILGYGLLGTLVVICLIVYRETVTPNQGINP